MVTAAYTAGPEFTADRDGFEPSNIMNVEELLLDPNRRITAVLLLRPGPSDAYACPQSAWPGPTRPRLHPSTAKSRLTRACFNGAGTASAALPLRGQAVQKTGLALRVQPMAMPAR